MAGKEAIAIVLDVGKSMFEKYSRDITRRRIDVAIDSIKTLVTQKILFNKTHEVALVLMGSDEAEDGDVMLAQEIKRPDLETVREMDDIKKAKPSSLPGGDIFKTLSNCMDMLDDYVKKKKYTKKCFVFTNGSGPSKYDQKKIKQLASKANNLATRVNFITIDFMEEDEPEKEKHSKVQHENRVSLEQFCDDAESKLFPSHLAMAIQKQFRSRYVMARAKYKGTLQITPDLRLMVNTYGKTTEEKFPSAKKYSLIANQSKNAKDAVVTLSREVFLHDDPTQTPIDAENKIKGYYYGKQLVPIPEFLEEKLKYKSEKCMKLLGFAEKRSVPRHFFLASVDMLIPQDDENHKRALASLIHALYELDKVAIVRYVYRENVAPKLACLFPHIGSNYECMWMTILPTVEDLRDYQFMSLKECTTQQEKAMGEFIETLDLMKVEDEGDEKEGLKTSSTYNPSLQYFYQCLIHRAFNEDDKLPEIDPVISNYVRPDKRIFQKAQASIENVEKSFTLKENKEKKDKGKVYWRQMLQEEAKKLEEAAMIEIETTNVKVEGEKEKGYRFDEDVVRKISQGNPVVDFRRMINEKTEDLTSSAIKQMSELIMKFIEESFQGNLYDKALDCLKELRKGCVQEDEAPEFNDFLQNVKDRFCNGKHAKFWQKVISHGLTLIDQTETKSSMVSPTEAKDFLMEEDKEVQAKIEQEQQELMDEIE